MFSEAERETEGLGDEGEEERDGRGDECEGDNNGCGDGGAEEDGEDERSPVAEGWEGRRGKNLLKL